VISEEEWRAFWPSAETVEDVEDVEPAGEPDMPVDEVAGDEAGSEAEAAPEGDVEEAAEPQITAKN
jgi:hypothetical protein